MNADAWFFRAGQLADGPWQTIVDESLPGWRHTGLRIADIAPGQELRLDAESRERIVVPLSGSFTVDHGQDGVTRRTLLAGRESVFDGPTDVLYLPTRSVVAIIGPGRVAIAEAPTEDVHPSRHISRTEVPVELRGADRSSRQVHNFGVPGVLDAGGLIVCEVITPAGNWSSFPAHKHDTAVAGQETELEEIYYFETALARDAAASAPATESAQPFGLFTVSTSPAGEIELTARVQSGDVVLVPFGYHGPAVAPPGYDLYYLNVMVGPERSWLISDDPGQSWIRTTWIDQEIDPRLPLGREGHLR
ncbi:5-deoxy-glucuronate isomerase [Herbiconiux sp. UC225_62]|uniref:5-deoxy-glucuronate isomerase n=1 Tax=Herbiconiux sp. UC225_62 TaxID=3350168 RepID=UPI0036D35AD7